mmetsp:Transcript_11116/g.14053  ORF Transcript_11116/g.14053 Transcript_11116/m.14053 type:complete len:205 (+) Transcript_11116:1903-2517(+)
MGISRVERLLGNVLDDFLDLMLDHVVSAVHCMLRLHFQDQVAVLSVDVAGVENGGVGLESATLLEPAARVEVVEIVAPVQLEAVRVRVVLMNLNVVEEEVPGHIIGDQVFSPGLKSGRPEVHAERLSLVHVSDRRLGVGHLAIIFAIDVPADVIGGPLESVSVPLVLGIEFAGVLVRLNLLVTLSIDHVGGKRLGSYRWHDFDV